MSYARFGLMILTSTLVMFVLMYLNTYALEHVFFSETRVYMALMMGAVMAVIMLAYMMGMYSNRVVNIAIFAGSILVFGISLWLVRSQVTVSGESYMRAMIPHHSIAIMTSSRAGIRDPRVRKLADEIIEAQRREIAEMRYLIGEVSAGRGVQSIYQDPPAEPGSVEDVMSNLLIGSLDLAPMPKAEADRIVAEGDRCTFNRSPQADPILWTSGDGGVGAAKLNGVLLTLQGSADPSSGAARFATPGLSITLHQLGEESDWRQNADLVFRLEGDQLEQELEIGYRGFLRCGAPPD